MNVVVKSRLESSARSRDDELNAAPAPCPASAGTHVPFEPRASRGRRRHSERGVALIITLLLLAVITFMAIAFLVLSRGQKSSVTTMTDLTVARGAADAALARAQAEMMAPILAWTNPMAVGMLVSTNYINPIGFTRGSGPTYTSPTNVSYTYANGLPLNPGGDALQNLDNLLYDPRAPVFLTNRLRGGYEFRYYVDLNRNGAFEPTGWVGVTNDFGQALRSGNNFVQSYQVGDPQWIGGLEFPDRPHSASNPFTYRYAYLVVPASQTLDVNYIHNQANNPAKTAFDPGGRDFVRNQGVGTWEINLGAFLYDLNTNTYAWGGIYDYTPPVIGLPTPLYVSRGNAFFDAFTILSNRYGGALSSQSPVAGVFGLFANGGSAFALDGMDGYSAGPVMTTSWRPVQDPDVAPVNRTLRPWPGADNTNHFFSSQDLFTRFRATDDFPTRLQAVGLRTNTYDRYTYYRLLSQLGSDSAPEPANKINLNYDNLVRTNSLGISSSTNFAPWRPMDFFTNAANALLANAGYNFTITNIQIYPTNYYTASVHRMLQLAVNIYDSTTNRTFAATGGRPDPYCPTVLRPLFRRTTIGTNTVVMIVGYREVIGTTLASSTTGPRIVELDNGNLAANLAQIPPISIGAQGNERLEPLVSGMPLVIGAKKGFPNFNEFAMQTFVYVSRLLEFRRKNNDVNAPVAQTNVMYVLTITNTFGLEAWNSYSNAYPRSLQLIAAADMTPVVTSVLDNGSLNPPVTTVLSNRVTRGTLMNIAPGAWSGWPDKDHARFSFVLPWAVTNNLVFTNATYSTRLGRLIPETHEFVDPPNQFFQPHWILNLNARLRFILVDTEAQRIVDYVNLNNWDPPIDIIAKLSAGADCSGNPASLVNAALDNPTASQWCTNRQHNAAPSNLAVPTMGIVNQISASLGMAKDALASFSLDPFSGRDSESAVDGFRFNLMGWGPNYSQDTGKTFYRSNVFYAPLTPFAPLYVHTTLQANDPLVHYTVGDLSFIGVTVTNADFHSGNPALPNLGQINDRYEPWGGNPNKPTGVVPPFQFAVKDPAVTRSDDWDFPTNKYPNVGWLGKVHRGTPWQTVFLKSTNIVLQGGSFPAQVLQSLAMWQKWTGNYTNGALWTYDRTGTNLLPFYMGDRIVLSPTNLVFPDAAFTLPTNDWRILDLFTTAFDQNSTRGQLSVNQTNLAAWSAVLAGVNILSNTTTSAFIQPAGVIDPIKPPALWEIVNGPAGIIWARTNFPNNTFQRMGDILAAPALTIASPYVLGGTNIVNDAVVERIPQQIMGLLRGGEQPRFVIYSYGQTLRPAEHSIVPSGRFFGLCTNYQITAEVATRAVVRIDGAPRAPHAVVESFNILPPD